MSYNSSWTPRHPGHIALLLDLSESMARYVNGQRLIDIVMNSVATLFRSLQCEIMAGDEIYNLFSMTIIGYNSDVVILNEFRDASEFNRFVIECRHRRWLFNTRSEGEAEPYGSADIAGAYHKAAIDITQWLNRQLENGYSTPAPIIINITGSEYDDNYGSNIYSALTAAYSLKSISTPDGNALVYNIHITDDTKAQRIVYPEFAPQDATAKFLFDASSLMPQNSARVDINGRIDKDEEIKQDSRAMVANVTDVDTLNKFLISNALRMITNSD